jgi:hypothetical protein
MHPEKNHLENIYRTKKPEEVSWTQEVPATSLDLIHSFQLPKTARIIDIGGGDSRLADFLRAARPPQSKGCHLQQKNPSLKCPLLSCPLNSYDITNTHRPSKKLSFTKIGQFSSDCTGAQQFLHFVTPAIN